MADDMRHKSEEYWKENLTPEQYHVLREKGTETPGTGKLLHNEETGEYRCAACGALLFASDKKYESTTPGLIGWPSFSEVAKSDAVELRDDDSMFMHRTEVICKNCGSHLGHVFDDGPPPTRLRYCINGVAMNFAPD